MNSIRVIVIDDEPLARLNVVDALAKFDHVNVVGTFESAIFPIETLISLQPDVVFLDIEMPKISGIDFAHTLTTLPHPPKVVFVTAYDDYAIQAFELHAVDYLLKPFDSQRFADTINRIEQTLHEKNASASISSLQAFKETHYLKQIMVRTTGSIRIIPIDDIIWFHSSGNYVEVHHKDGRHLHRVTLGFLEDHLAPELFVRTHRSVIVRKSYIREIITEDESKFSVLLANGEKVPLSKHYREDLIKFFENN